MNTLAPTYVRPAPRERSKLPLFVVYNPKELPDKVVLAVPTTFPPGDVLNAQSLVTQHLKSALESMFEQVNVVTDPHLAPADAVVGVVHFVELGLQVANGGKTVVGTLEWSLTLSRSGTEHPLYHWGERIVGEREGDGAFGALDPQDEIRGAIEASLRALLKDMDTKDVIGAVAAAG